VTGFDPYALPPEDFDRNPPLWFALLARDLPAAQALFDQGQRVDDVLEADGNSFLHRAAQDGDREFVLLLLRSGAERSLRSFDYTARTPLHWAAMEGHVEILQDLLTAGADVNANDDSRIGNTAIREAVYGGHVECVRMLLAAGADPTIRGWMAINAVDEAYNDVRGGLDGPAAHAIRELLAPWPSNLRDRSRRSDGA